MCVCLFLLHHHFVLINFISFNWCAHVSFIFSVELMQKGVWCWKKQQKKNIGDLFSLVFMLLQQRLTFFCLTNYLLLFCTINRVVCMLVVYILVGNWRRQDTMNSLKQRTATFRFRHDDWTQDCPNGFVKHRLQALLRQCWTL